MNILQELYYGNISEFDRRTKPKTQSSKNKELIAYDKLKEKLNKEQDKLFFLFYNIIMETIQITKNIFDNKVLISPKRFDMAIIFYCLIKKSSKYYLVTFYNPVWKMFYPFYDDLNKTPILKQSTARTYRELIEEADNIFDINLDEKIQLAKNRFKELFGCNCDVEVVGNSYELKYSKTANLYTVYKFYNFIITNVDNLKAILNPKNIKCKLFELDNLNSNVISNAIEFCAKYSDILKQKAIEMQILKK